MSSVAKEVHKALTVEQYLNAINYSAANDSEYIPESFSLEFVNFIKLVNGTEGEENLTPVLHYKMLDQISGDQQNIINMLFRGSAKTTLFGEYLFLYLAVYGKLPNFGDVNVAIYVSDSMENGVKNMRKNLEFRRENSEFLMQYIPVIKFTESRWEFQNIDGKKLIVKAYGAKTGVRGTKELGTRPNLAILDDLISDEDARSDTIISSVEDTVYKAIEYALHPKKSKVIWSGTPFNARDPLYKAVESGAWAVNVYPVCEEFPCERKDFKGAWEDRFDYDYVLAKYEKALRSGKIADFNQEMMLRIISEEERVIQDSDIVWYRHANVLTNKPRFNFYITTDFATSAKTGSDFSVIAVWAYNNNGDWLWCDGICKKQLMDKNIDDLFRLVQMYKPKEVGVEVSGQQKGFISWIQNKMMDLNTYFNLASDSNGGSPGIRPVGDKLVRFNIVEPWFKMKKIWLPEELKTDPRIVEMTTELSLVTIREIKSKHDDCIDVISMLSVMKPYKPAEAVPHAASGASDPWDDEIDDLDDTLESYVV